MNGATEATLADLLREARATNVNLSALVSKLGATANTGGGGSAASAAAGLTSFTSSLNPAKIALGAFEGVANVVSGVFQGLGFIIGKTIDTISEVGGNLLKFGMAAAQGETKLSKLYDAFSALPGPFGMLASIVSTLVAYTEGLLDQWRVLTKQGAGFGGDLFEMSNMAARAHLTLGEFSGVIQKNSDLFATLGGTAQGGIKQFVDIQTKLMGPNSKYGEQMRSLGYNAEDGANAIASYLRGMQTLSKAEMADSEKMSANVAAYVVQLDGLTKLTGKNREDLEATRQKAMAEESFQTFFQTLTDDQKKAADAGISVLANTAGDVMTGQVKLVMQGVNAAVTEEQAALFAATQGQSLRSAQAIDAAIKSGKSQAEIDRITKEETLKVAKAYNKTFSELGPEQRALMAQNGDLMNKVGQPLMKFARQFEDEAKLTDEQRKVRDQQASQANSEAKKLMDAQAGIREMGNQLTIMFNDFLKPLMPGLIRFGTEMITIINSLIGSDGFKDTVNEISSWLKTLFTDLSNAKNFDDVINVFKVQGKKAMDGLYNMIEPAWNNTIKPALKSMWAEAKPVIIKLFEELFELMWQGIKDVLHIGPSKNERAWIEQEKKADSGKEKWAKQYQSYKQERIEQDNYVDPNAAMMGATPAGQQEDWKYYQEFQKKHPELFNTGQATPKPKASGGLVSPGSYIVGEKGPELMTTDAGGNIITNENIKALIASVGSNNSNNLDRNIQMLNSLTTQMLSVMRENAEYTKRNFEATRSLSNDLFA
jgi:hypothetical protein